MAFTFCSTQHVCVFAWCRWVSKHVLSDFTTMNRIDVIGAVALPCEVVLLLFHFAIKHRRVALSFILLDKTASPGIPLDAPRVSPPGQ